MCHPYRQASARKDFQQRKLDVVQALNSLQVKIAAICDVAPRDVDWGHVAQLQRAADKLARIASGPI
jgi:hypothetical protein